MKGNKREIIQLGVPLFQPTNEEATSKSYYDKTNSTFMSSEWSNHKNMCNFLCQDSIICQLDYISISIIPVNCSVYSVLKWHHNCFFALLFYCSPWQCQWSFPILPFSLIPHIIWVSLNIFIENWIKRLRIEQGLKFWSVRDWLRWVFKDMFCYTCFCSGLIWNHVNLVFIAL